MNRLEEYICDHKSLFDEEPETGHFERLHQRMEHQRRKNVVLRWTASVAASLVLLFSVGIIRQYIGTHDSVTAVCENVIDQKACYLDRMNTVASHIDALTMDFDLWDRQQVMTDVQNIIDAADSGFENELPDELPDETAQSILADYYQRNLESLNGIVKILETP